MMVAVPMEISVYEEFTLLCNAMGWPADYAIEEFARRCIEDFEHTREWLNRPY